MEQKQLSEDLARIRQVFNLDEILKDLNQDITVKYYTDSEWGYRHFHSQQGCVHLALNYDGKFDERGYYEQPRWVSGQIEELQAQNVLELGSGKGFNSCFLAQQHPDVRFTGKDITPVHVAIAQKKAKPFKNVRFQIGNFNQLPFKAQTFDLIFAVDCLCHAGEPQVALAEIYRVLKPKGRAVIFDGYRIQNFSEKNSDLQLATALVEVAMGVNQGFCPLRTWKQAIASVGLTPIAEENLSHAIEPNMKKLQQLARKYYRKNWRGTMMRFLLPKYLMRNSIAGLLMPYTIVPQNGTLAYYATIVERPI
jgi:ubiquinone/menaquinone biosynthesis C-methylase UbiE